MARVSFIGLGVMGYPMAGHLVRAGHRVVVYNRTRQRADSWLEEHGDESSAVATSPRAAATESDFVMVCVGNDDDVRDVVLGKDGAIAGMEPGAILIDHTTASANLAQRLDGVCRENGCGFLDAPVSGGQAGAESGALTVMCGGNPETFERVAPVAQAYAKAFTLLGPAGSGQLTKMVNQICIAGVLQGLSEGLHFAEVAGLDPQQVVSAISQGAAQSWQMDNRAKTMIEGKFDYGFATSWMQKDLGIALREARHHGVSLPVAALVNQFYTDVAALGGARWDTSSLIERLRALRGAGSAGQAQSTDIPTETTEESTQR